MGHQNEFVNTRYKKICAVVLSVFSTLMVVKILGMDFFIFDFVDSINKYDIRLNDLGKLLKDIFVKEIKNIVVIFFILRLKHGQIYKYIIIYLATFALICAFMNIFKVCNRMTDLISAVLIYLPKYINYYIYIIVQERAEPYIEQYNCSKKIRDEIKALLLIFTITVSFAIILSFIQAILAIAVI